MSRVSPLLQDDRQSIAGAKDNAQLKKMWPVVRERRSVLPLHIPFGVLMDLVAADPVKSPEGQ